MSIPVECGECGASYKVKDEKAGTRIKCPKCSAVIKVPLADDDDEFVEPTPSKRKAASKGSSQKGAKKSGAKSGGGSNNKAVIVGAAVFGVLVVGGIAFWLMSGRKPDPQVAQNQPATPPTANGESPAAATTPATASAPTASSSAGPANVTPNPTPVGATTNPPPAGTTTSTASAGQASAEDDPVAWAEVNQAGSKMKQVMLAFHNLSLSTGGSFVPDPAAAPNFYGPDGRLKVSWRVHLLLYLNHFELYQKFKLDEAWDSPNNKPLIDQMPSVYQMPGVAGGKTRFVGFSGRSVQGPNGLRPVASIPIGGPMKMVSVTDGTVNTAMFVLAPAERAVTWTSPDDIPFDPAKPEETLAVVRSPTSPFLLTAMMDGSVRPFSAKLDAAALSRLVHPGDGQPLGLEAAKWRELYTLAKPKPGPLHLAYLSDKVYGVTVIQPAKLLANPLVASMNQIMLPSDGLTLSDIEQMVIFLTVDGDPSAATGFKFIKPVTPQSHPGFFANRTTLFQHDATTFLFGPPEALNTLTTSAATSTSTLLKDKLNAANLQPEIQFVMQVSHPDIQDFLSGKRPVPGMAAGLSLMKPYAKLQTIEGWFIPSQPKLLEVIATSADATSAEAVKKQVNVQLAEFKSALPLLKAPPEAKVILNELVVATEGNTTRASLTMSEPLKTALIGFSKEVAQATNMALINGEQAQQFKKLRQIGNAFHNHHDLFRCLPPVNDPKHFNAEGKLHLSWRVHALRMMGDSGQENRDNTALFNQFHLDEPWDSPHNKPLAEKMPDAFKTQGVTKPGYTSILAISGPGTAFTGGKGIRFQDITDGTSNTILVVAASPEKAVPWTKPDDLEFDPQNPKACFEPWPAQESPVLFADGSIRKIGASVDAEFLKAYFTIAGGEKVPSR